MRSIKAAFACALLTAISAPALAEDLEQSTLAQILAIATKGYAKPTEAKIRNVHKSLAANGKGFCGEITIEGMGDSYTTFHVLLETANGPSVLRLSDFNAPETDPQSATVHLMMRNFGCVD